MTRVALIAASAAIALLTAQSGNAHATPGLHAFLRQRPVRPAPACTPQKRAAQLGKPRSDAPKLDSARSSLAKRKEVAAMTAGKLHVQADGRVSGPASISYNDPFPCVNGNHGSGAMMGVIMHTMVGDLPG